MTNDLSDSEKIIRTGSIFSYIYEGYNIGKINYFDKYTLVSIFYTYLTSEIIKKYYLAHKKIAGNDYQNFKINK